MKSYSPGASASLTRTPSPVFGAPLPKLLKAPVIYSELFESLGPGVIRNDRLAHHGALEKSENSC